MYLKAALAGSILIAGAGTALAQNDALQACSAIVNQKARLDCYDGLARGTAPAAPGTGVTGPAAEPSFNTGGGRRRGSPAPVVTGRASGDTFGLEAVHRRRADEPVRQNEAMVHIAAARDNGIGHWIFTLDTGAVWQMTEAVPGFKAPAKGALVRIRRGAVGSYFMDAGHQAGVRIARLK